MKVRIYKTSEPGYRVLIRRILARRGGRQGDIEQRVNEIIRTVQQQGDRAVLRYTQEFDRRRVTRATMEVTADEIDQAVAKVPAKDL
ncbi:MAG TPA: histidinol dehydrogenase, partial [Candidatus Binatia bacterium]|nr:histidinol dehydrogenase [Candidatus Binatia bacterium]